MDNKDKKEQRKSKRYSFKERILINGSIVFNSIDISEGGLYIYTGRSFQRDSIVDVMFMRKKFTVKAIVKHNQPGIGMGLQFIDMSKEHQAMIKRLVKEILKEPDEHPQEKRKVLLVEDNALTRSIYKGRLTMEGFSVIEANDGIDALRILLKEQLPDLIILDLHLVRMDGMKLLAIIRETPNWMNIPVIVCSGKGTKDVIQKVLEAGAEEFLSKMVTTPAKLADTAKAVIKYHYGK
jgi:CheY-like chemotaxis protein